MRRLTPLFLAAFALVSLACEKKSPPPAATPEPHTGQAATPAPTPPPASDTLVLGVVGSLTGGQATFGQSMKNGVEMAVKEANDAGGMKGKKFSVRVYDNQSKPEEAAQATTRLVTQDKVLAIIGDVASSNSLAMAEKAQAAKVPMISPASTNPAVTQKGDYIFRVCFIDPFQGFVMAKFAHENLKLKQVAILQDNKSAYSIGLTEVFTQKFTEMGGKVLASESYSQGDTDFRAQLGKLKGLKPQALYVPGYYNDVGLIARQAREMGITVPLLGGDGWDSEKLFELAGTALDGSFFSNHYAPTNPDTAVQKFINDYKTTYNGTPDALAALGYDAARVAMAAIEKSPDLSGAAIRDAIAATKDFPGIAGTITLDANRNAFKSAVILKVGDGKTDFVTSIKP